MSPVLMNAKLPYTDMSRGKIVNADWIEMCSISCCLNDDCDMAVWKNGVCYNFNCQIERDCLWENDKHSNAKIVYIWNRHPKLGKYNFLFR